MLITERLRASATIDWSGSERPGMADAAIRHVAAHIIALADERAWKVREESVHIRRVDGRPQEWMSTIEGVWSPRCATFVGGEYDGDELDVRREADGLPLQLLRLPYRSGLVIDDMHPRPIENPSYARAGIDPIRDVWVYQLVR